MTSPTDRLDHERREAAEWAERASQFSGSVRWENLSDRLSGVAALLRGAEAPRADAEKIDAIHREIHGKAMRNHDAGTMFPRALLEAALLDFANAVKALGGVSPRASEATPPKKCACGGAFVQYAQCEGLRCSRCGASEPAENVTALGSPRAQTTLPEKAVRELNAAVEAWNRERFDEVELVFWNLLSAFYDERRSGDLIAKARERVMAQFRTVRLGEFASGLSESGVSAKDLQAAYHEFWTVTPTAQCTAENAGVFMRTFLDERAGSPSPEAPSPKGIYIASRSRHGQRWVRLRESGVPIISTWINESGEGQTADWTDLWNRCLRESASAKALILYAERYDDYAGFKGAWAEAGAALANGVPVYFVAPSPWDDYSASLLRHRLVTFHATLDGALEEIAGSVSSPTSTPHEELLARSRASMGGDTSEMIDIDAAAPLVEQSPSDPKSLGAASPTPKEGE